MPPGDRVEKDNPLFTLSIRRAYPGTGAEADLPAPPKIPLDDLDNPCIDIHRAVRRHRPVIGRENLDRNNQLHIPDQLLKPDGCSLKNTGKREDGCREDGKLAALSETPHTFAVDRS